jgi:hypothetical protein
VKILAVVILVTLIASCNKNLTEINSDDLIGVWSLKYTGEDGYPYHFSQLAFMDNGHKCILSYNFNRSGEVSVSYYKSTYVVKDGVLISTVAYSSSPFGLPEGYIIKDRLTHYDESSFNVFMIQPKGEFPENHQKLVDVDPDDVCNVVEQYRISQKEALVKNTHNK